MKKEEVDRKAMTQQLSKKAPLPVLKPLPSAAKQKLLSQAALPESQTDFKQRTGSFRTRTGKRREEDSGEGLSGAELKRIQSETKLYIAKKEELRQSKLKEEAGSLLQGERRVLERALAGSKKQVQQLMRTLVQLRQQSQSLRVQSEGLQSELQSGWERVGQRRQQLEGLRVRANQLSREVGRARSRGAGLIK